MRVVSSRHCRFGLKNVCALGGVRLVPSPPLFRLAMPSRRCGGGWAAAPAPACRGVPPALAPVALVLVAPSARKGSFLRPLAALALRSASRPPLRPFPCSRGSPGRCGASSRPSALGSRSLRAGSPVPPCPAPFGGSLALAPPGGAPAAAVAAACGSSVAPPGVGVGAAAAAAAARLRRPVLLPARARRGLWFWGLARRCCGLRCGCAV